MTAAEPHEPTDPAAPPPPGADTPVPADAAERAAASGRAHRTPARSVPEPDRLVPSTALETRAEERERMRRARLGLGAPAPSGVANPAAGMPGGRLMPSGLVPAVAESMPQRFVPAGWPQDSYGGRVYGGAPYGTAPHDTAPYGANPYGTDSYGTAPAATGPYLPASGGAQPMPGGALPYGAFPAAYPSGAYPSGAYPSGAYAPGPYASGPYPYAPQLPYGQAPYPALAPVLPPRIAWSRPQRRAAILGSWGGQTVMALATHLLTAFFLIVGFAFLLHSSGEPIDDFDADSFTAIIARWTMGDRVWATALIGVLAGGGLLAGGWLISALWAKSAGLAKPHRSTWLAWLCTTAATGMIGVVVWPMALVFGFMFVLMSSGASLTTGSMWSTLFWLLGIAVVLTGGVGLLFGWLFFSQARPRVDFEAIAEAEEAAARARDEEELTRVRLRGEAARPPGADRGSTGGARADSR